jgi:hypothetical protein
MLAISPEITRQSNAMMKKQPTQHSTIILKPLWKGGFKQIPQPSYIASQK